jgi:hypothetical protein
MMRLCHATTPLFCIAILTTNLRATDEPTPVSDRQAWRYGGDERPGAVVLDYGSRWVEITPDGRKLHFEEVARTEAWLELYDKPRGIHLRLYSDHGDLRTDQRPEWQRWQTGRWVAVASLPEALRLNHTDHKIRLAYFVAKDRKPTAHYEQKIRVLMQFVSDLYLSDLKAKGYKTPGLALQQRDGEPIVHLIQGKREAKDYNGAPRYDGRKQWASILEEIPESVGSPQRHAIVLFAETYDDGPAPFEWPGGFALGARFSSDGGVGMFSAWILRDEFCATTVAEQHKRFFDETPIEGRIALGHGRMNSPRFEFIEDGFGAVAHELGHALGLSHDRRNDRQDIMANGFRNLRWNLKPTTEGKRVGFSSENARLLYSSRHLAADLDVKDNAPPTATVTLGPLRQGDRSLDVSLEASDDRGLRAVVFYNPQDDTVIGGQELAGKKQNLRLTLPIASAEAGRFKLVTLISDTGGNLACVAAAAAAE